MKILTGQSNISFPIFLFLLYLRFDYEDFDRAKQYLFPYIPFFALYAAFIYAVFSLYSAKWRFASIPDLLNIFKAVFILTCSLLVIDYIFTAKNLVGSLVIGKKSMLVYAFLQPVLLGAPRLIYRYYKTLHTTSFRDEAENIIIIGRATDVEFISRAVDVGHIKGNILGFISPYETDNAIKVRGIKSIGRVNDIDQILATYKLRGVRVHQAILIAEALKGEANAGNLLGSLRRNSVILNAFTLNDHDQGKVGVKNLEHVKDEDVLLRSLVRIDSEPLKAHISNKIVMITGGGGSIGAEITMQIAQFGAGRVVIVENSEPALYSILERLELAGYADNITGILCDIRDQSRLKSVFEEIKPHLVYHAAALKHVPYLEDAPIEAFKTNTLGTMNVATCAKDFAAEAFVLISTDKATNPKSVLGATKRLAEFYVQLLDRESITTRFTAVRFGNVLGTSGSVVPRFAKQIAEGGPVTVTHIDMVRYFMTVKEATSLVLTSSFHAVNDRLRSASIYILNMGQPVRIYDLAERMIKMSGFEPHKDMKIKVTGMRPGERLNEELFHSHEPMIDIDISGMVAAKKGKLSPVFLKETLAELTKLAESQNQTIASQKIHEAVKTANAKEKFE
jgi:FlaA1/EpsC-like NDP-sugar epimerase